MQLDQKLFNDVFIFLILVMLSFLVRFLEIKFKKHFSLTSFSEDENHVYIPHTKEFYYTKESNLLSQGKRLDIKYTYWDKILPDKSRICLHFKSKKFIYIKSMKVSFLKYDQYKLKEFEFLEYEPYYEHPQAVLSSFPKKVDRFVEISLDELQQKKLPFNWFGRRRMRAEIYWRPDLPQDYISYGKGCRYPFNAKYIKIDIEFMDGGIETFELEANHQDMYELLKREYYPHEDLKIDLKTSVNFKDLVTLNNCLYMFNRNKWMQEVKKIFEFIDDNSQFNKLDLLLIFLYEYDSDEKTSKFIYENLRMIYSENFDWSKDCMEKIIEMLYKTNLKLDLHSEEELTELKNKGNIKFFVTTLND